MARLSAYLNEIVSLIVMLLMIVALVAGQAGATTYELAMHDASQDAELVEVIHVRLEDE